MPQTPDQIYADMEVQLTDYLIQNRMRKTPERYALLDLVCQQKRAFTAENLYEQMRQNFPVSLATIYNTMLLFEKCGIVHRLEHQAGEPHAYYERAKRRGIHMQLICTNCGREQDFFDKNISTAVSMHRFNNFNAAHFSLYVYGKCKYCHKKKKTDKNN